MSTGDSKSFAKALAREFQRIVALALHAAAHILGFGQRAQQPVLGLGKLGLGRGKPVLGGERNTLVGQLGRGDLVRPATLVVRRPRRASGRFVLFLAHNLSIHWATL